MFATIWTTVAQPSGSSGNQLTRLQSRSGFRQALCSPGNTAAGRCPSAAWRPRSSRCRASVALAQKTSSPGTTPKDSASSRRASSSRNRARCPSLWVLVGLAQSSARVRHTAAAASGWGGVVALASK